MGVQQRLATVAPKTDRCPLHRGQPTPRLPAFCSSLGQKADIYATLTVSRMRQTAYNNVTALEAGRAEITVRANEQH